MAYFFAILFVRNPEFRPMFPLALDGHRQRAFDALARYVWASDRPGDPSGWLSELAREHLKFGVKESHYRPFRDALLAAVRAFSDGSWSPQVEAAWEGALDHLVATISACAQQHQNQPAWWLAEVTEHDLRRPDLAVLTLRPDPQLPFRPGQHVSVQVPRWPRVWREYSVANAPREDGLLRLHVRAIPAGMVSASLVHQTRPGDTLILGRARGEMTVDALASRHVVCITGGTGLSPVKAIIEALASPQRPRACTRITLFLGARTQADLYDLPELRRIAARCPPLTVIPVISGDAGYQGIRGTAAEVAAAHLPPGTGDVVICGPPGMVTRAACAVASNAPAARIHLDSLPGSARWKDHAPSGLPG